MKLKIENFEIEIKAKSKNSNRFNKEDTLKVLNMLAIAFYNSRQRNEFEGYEALAKRDYENSIIINDFLDSNGFFDDIRNM